MSARPSLPSCYRNDPLVERLVRCQANRTVQITVRCGDEIEVGTGFVHTVTMKGSNVFCQCDACEESAKKCQGEIDIRTAYHVIKDNPPKNITCTLNYDSHGSAVATTFVVRLKHVNSDNDTICLVSVTCQETVLEHFKGCIEEYSALY
ncbi:hypothetical protein Btru_045933 [Bulinus truncatus]|nr:hypothetical protein Btru_045933 [Bulinus truncatus]